MHDTICETPKLASSSDNICKFEIDDYILTDYNQVNNGSFSYDSNQINSGKAVKCFQPVQQRGSLRNTKYAFKIPKRQFNAKIPYVKSIVNWNIIYLSKFFFYLGK